MINILVFGNSGSGKSTLAKRLASEHQIGHLDLDTIAWQASVSAQSPPNRTPIAQAHREILAFTQENQGWVIEGCYTDLLTLVAPLASEIIYLNLPVEACVANAKSRPWEPHKYDSKAAQDANLPMLIDWIRQYECREDDFSKVAHETLYRSFDGCKKMLVSNNHSSC